MRTPSAKTHIALGQTFLVTSLLLAAVYLGLVPDRQQMIRQGRAALAEAVAINGSALVTRSDLRRLETTLGLVVERNADLLSAAVRRADGRALVAIGDHEHGWQEDSADHSTESQVKVPIWSAGQEWGQLELRFTPAQAPSWLGITVNDRVTLVGFVGLFCFVLFYLYLRKMLQHLDPSQAVPTHVRSALDTLAEGLLVVDLKARIVLANEAFATLVGRRAEELLGQNASDLPWVDADGEALPQATLPWARALADGESQRNDMVQLRDGDAELRTFLVNCSPVLGSSGRHGGVLISLDDVTQLEEHKAELSAAKEEAEAANHAKSEFLANISHEIRTPMNAILGYTEVLKRGYEKGEASRQKYLETIRSSGEHLLQLINDILDLSKVESGHLEVEHIRLAPHQIIREAIAVLSGKASEKAISLDFDVEGAIPATILSDPTRLRQIVTNLVSNAIKFTERGGVKITARMATSGGARRLAIDVADSGIGVPAAAVEAIFDPFVQADSSVTRRFGGTGLGLPISRRFARLLGGDICVSSVPGEGSTFTVTIDAGPLEGIEMLSREQALAAVSEPAHAAAGAWRFPAARVLVVDDGDENRELVQLVLEEVGLEVEGAENGQVGVDKAVSGRFDVILMDMQMPVMDGYTATSLLRRQGLQTPIIALTANAMKGFERECLEVGCTGYLTKPVDIDTLTQTLADLLGGERRQVGEGTGPAEGTEPRSRPADALAASGPPLVSRLASNPRFLATVEKFVARLAEKLESMEESFAARDFEELAGLAHWLKGSGGMVGFDAFTAPAANLEMLAREGKESEIGAAIQELRELSDRIRVGGSTDHPESAKSPHGGSD